MATWLEDHIPDVLPALWVCGGVYAAQNWHPVAGVVCLGGLWGWLALSMSHVSYDYPDYQESDTLKAARKEIAKWSDGNLQMFTAGERARLLNTALAVERSRAQRFDVERLLNTPRRS